LLPTRETTPPPAATSPALPAEPYLLTSQSSPPPAAYSSEHMHSSSASNAKPAGVSAKAHKSKADDSTCCVCYAAPRQVRTWGSHWIADLL
jgi:hypothetical protein